MKQKLFEQFEKKRNDFETALDKSLAVLDSNHYPQSLLQCLRLVLKAPGSPRGLPLLTGSLADSQGRRVGD